MRGMGDHDAAEQVITLARNTQLIADAAVTVARCAMVDTLRHQHRSHRCILTSQRNGTRGGIRRVPNARITVFGTVPPEPHNSPQGYAQNQVYPSPHGGDHMHSPTSSQTVPHHRAQYFSSSRVAFTTTQAVARLSTSRGPARAQIKSPPDLRDRGVPLFFVPLYGESNPADRGHAW